MLEIFIFLQKKVTTPPKTKKQKQKQKQTNKQKQKQNKNKNKTLTKQKRLFVIMVIKKFIIDKTLKRCCPNKYDENRA